MENLFAHGVTNPVINEFFRASFLGIGNSEYGQNIHPPHKGFFRGVIDEARIYRRALTAEEIADNYRKRGQGLRDDPSLVGWWRFDEGEREIAKDSSAFNNDGTIIGASWVEGLSGYALKFDGKDDYIDCGNDESLRITTGSLTLEAWVKTTAGGRVISTRAGTGGDSWYEIIVTPRGKLNVHLCAPFPAHYTIRDGSIPVNDGKWHHLAMVRDADDQKVRLFVNGKLDVEVYDRTAGLSLTPDGRALRQALEIRQSVGMNEPILYFLTMHAGNPQDEHSLRELKRRVKELREFVKPFGINEVYLYGMDERKGEVLKSQRPAWRAVREAGGRIFVAGHRQRYYHAGLGDHFELVGDLQDLFICAGAPERQEAYKWHSLGHRIGVYGNPQGGAEYPEVFRRNFGLLLWKHNYDVAMTFSYQGCIGSGAGWSEFCLRHYRPHMMTYPTADGVINTIQWAGYREGIDDARYLNTLLKAIERAEESPHKKAREAALSARKYLEGLDINRNLDTIRLEIIAHILKIQGASQ